MAVSEIIVNANSGGGVGINWFDKDYYYKISSLQSYTNGMSVPFDEGTTFLFCKDYSSVVVDSSSGALKIYGITGDEITYIGLLNSISFPLDVSNYDYLMCVRDGSTLTRQLTFS